MAKKQNSYKKNTLKNATTVSKKKTKKKSSTRKTKSLIKFKAFGFLKNKNFQRISGIVLIFTAIIMFFSFLSYLFTWKIDDNIFKLSSSDILFNKDIQVHNKLGRVGALLSHLFIKQWFGVSSFIFVLLFAQVGLRLLGIKILSIKKTLFHSTWVIILLSSAIAYVLFKSEYILFGGSFGNIIANEWLRSWFGGIGAAIFLFLAIITYVTLRFKIKWTIFDKFKSKKKEIGEEDNSNNEEKKETNSINTTNLNQEEENNNKIDLSNNKEEETTPTENKNTVDFTNTSPTENKDKQEIIDDGNGVGFTINVKEEEKEENNTEQKTYETVLSSEAYDPEKSLSNYKFPPFELLSDHGETNLNIDKEELSSKKDQIVSTLQNYKIKIDKITATVGPTITLYEIIPAPGVRISKIKNLEDDIALSLSALGIRIIAPIPGRGTIGIEVPNQKPQIVSMLSIINSDKFRNNDFDLPIGLGKTIDNKSFIADLAKMPHLLMAGATGQGKSVGLNAIITSLLYKKHPSQLKFVMVDPKKVELNLYSKIENHYLAKLPDSEEAIITDTTKVVHTLNSLCIEMDNRYELLKAAHTRNIKEYNKKFLSRKLNPEKNHRYLPYIVLVVDEYADLMMTAGKEIENPITRLAQLARAIGIHLIIATQRPSVNVITGIIKANFPARIAFRVTSKIDSRTILDTGGADQLIGRGDLLLSLGSDLKRIQCAFVDTPEVEEIVDYIEDQQGFPTVFELPEFNEEMAAKSSGGSSPSDIDDKDVLFAEAARIIVQHQHGSTSLLQRKLKLGYNRAGRIIDQLEEAGIVGQYEGSKAREVRIKDETSLEQFLKSIE
jgi:DNA segregation ATPase FtsK/SpoIIIE, S-DNA-T family